MRGLMVGLVMMSLSVPVFAAGSPFTGTWKQKPGNGGASQSTAKVEADNQHLKLDQQFMDDKGQSYTVSFDAKFDGKEYPVSGDPGFDSVVVDRLNSHHIKATWKKAGKAVSTSDVQVSRDGRTTTVTYTDYRGKSPEKSTDVYEKQ